MKSQELFFANNTLKHLISAVSEFCSLIITVKTLNIGTPRPATVVVLNLKQFNFTMK